MTPSLGPGKKPPLSERYFTWTENLTVVSFWKPSLLLTLAILCGVVSQTLKGTSEIGASLLVFIAGVLASLVLQSWHNARFEKSIEDKTAQIICLLKEHYPQQHIEAFKTVELAYVRLLNLLPAMSVKKAVLLQYSGRTSRLLIETLLLKGAEVELFLQHDSTPLAVGSAHQASVTKQAVKNLIDWVDKAQPNAEALKISLYKPPASLGAVIIDDAYIVLSLYLYKPLAGAVKKQSPKDTVMLKGHTVFAFLLKGGTPEFNLLKPLIEEHIKDIKTESIEYIETP